MKIAGIALDNYKVPTFRSNLKKGGFEWTEHEGLTKDCKFFKVKYTCKNFKKLYQIVKFSNEVSQGRD